LVTWVVPGSKWAKALAAGAVKARARGWQLGPTGHVRAHAGVFCFVHIG
jgi:hypothetical protein